MKKRVAILISGRGSNMHGAGGGGARSRLSGGDGARDLQSPGRPGLAARAVSRLEGARHRPQGLCNPGGVRCRRRCRAGGERHRPRLPRGFHAHPGQRVRAALARPPAQHPSLPAAVVQRPPPAQAGARRGRAHQRLHRAFRHARSSIPGRSSPRPRFPCSRAIRPILSRNASSSPSTSSIRSPCDWWRRARPGWRAGGCCSKEPGPGRFPISRQWHRSASVVASHSPGKNAAEAREYGQAREAGATSLATNERKSFNFANALMRGRLGGGCAGGCAAARVRPQTTKRKQCRRSPSR